MATASTRVLNSPWPLNQKEVEVEPTVRRVHWYWGVSVRWCPREVLVSTNIKRSHSFFGGRVPWTSGSFEIPVVFTFAFRATSHELGILLGTAGPLNQVTKGPPHTRFKHLSYSSISCFQQLWYPHKSIAQRRGLPQNMRTHQQPCLTHSGRKFCVTQLSTEFLRLKKVYNCICA